MNLTKDQLQEVYENAGLFLSPEEIAILLDVDVIAFQSEIKSKQGEVYLHYMKGKTESKREGRINVIKMRNHGSPQAQELAEKYITEQRTAEKNARR